MKTFCFVFAVWLAVATLHAGGLPEPVVPDGVGVNIHFTRGHTKELAMIADAGFKWVRMDFVWEAIERKRGEYDWSDYDAFTAELKRHGLRPYYILDYSNPLYESRVAGTNPITGKLEAGATASPQHPASVEAYARWAATAARHFSGSGAIWEIWNEPNISFWQPAPDVHQYTALALAATEAIRKADPRACIVAPATSGFPWKFLETVFQSGLLTNIDAVSVHPYRSPRQAPETAAGDIKRLRELIGRYAPAGKTIPILSGEWGYSSNTRGVSQETQAAFIARQQLSNLLNGIPLSVWYDWKNDGPDPAENEHNFGTVNSDLSPKPAYKSIQQLTRELSGYRLRQRLMTTNDSDFVLSFTNSAGKSKLAAWTLAAPHRIAVNSKQKIELDAVPKYIPVAAD